MQDKPELFDAYHEGFRAQVRTWASNPVDLATQWLRSKPKIRTIADFGCGDAQLAQELSGSHVVHSYDLVARNPHVTACTLSDVPCESGTDLSCALPLSITPCNLHVLPCVCALLPNRLSTKPSI